MPTETETVTSSAVQGTAPADFSGDISTLIYTTSNNEPAVDIMPMPVIDMYASYPNPSMDTPPQYSYERDPDILRAQFDLLSSEHSTEYAQAAYESILNVQQQCQADYLASCTNTGDFIIALSDFFNEFSGPSFVLNRRLSAQNGAPPSFIKDKVIDPVRHIYNALTNKPPHNEGERPRERGQDGPRMGRPQMPMHRPFDDRQPREMPMRQEGPMRGSFSLRGGLSAPHKGVHVGPPPDMAIAGNAGPADRQIQGQRPEGHGPRSNWFGGWGGGHGGNSGGSDSGEDSHGWHDHHHSNSGDSAGSNSGDINSAATPSVTAAAPASAFVMATSLSGRRLSHAHHGGADGNSGHEGGWHHEHGHSHGDSNSNSEGSDSGSNSANIVPAMNVVPPRAPQPLPIAEPIPPMALDSFEGPPSVPGDSSSASSESGFFHHEHSSSSSSSMDALQRHHGQHGEHGHRHHHNDMVTYQGSLGFGSDGDACIYSKFESLSQPCQDAIYNVYSLRAEYDDSSSGRGCHGFFFLFIVGAILAMVIGRKRRMRRQKVIDLLKALEANPALKTTVEAETGLQVPPPPPVCCAGKHRCCRAILTFVGVVVLGFCMVIISLVVSGHLVMLLTSVDEVGNVVYPSPESIILIVALVIFTNMLLLISFANLAVAVVKRLRARRQQGGNSSPSTPQPCRGQTCFISRIIQLIPSFRQAPAGGDNSGLYAPLNMDESQHEMVPVQYGQVQPQTFVQPQQIITSHSAPQIYLQTSPTTVSPMYVPVTVSAESMSNINML